MICILNQRDNIRRVELREQSGQWYFSWIQLTAQTDVRNRIYGLKSWHGTASQQKHTEWKRQSAPACGAEMHYYCPWSQKSREQKEQIPAACDEETHRHFPFSQDALRRLAFICIQVNEIQLWIRDIEGILEYWSCACIHAHSKIFRHLVRWQIQKSECLDSSCAEQKICEIRVTVVMQNQDLACSSFTCTEHKNALNQRYRNFLEISKLWQCQQRNRQIFKTSGTVANFQTSRLHDVRFDVRSWFQQTWRDALVGKQPCHLLILRDELVGTQSYYILTLRGTLFDVRSWHPPMSLNVSSILPWYPMILHDALFNTPVWCSRHSLFAQNHGIHSIFKNDPALCPALCSEIASTTIK